MKFVHSMRWLALLFILAVPVSVSAADADGFESMFDGKTLDGWDGNPDFWKVENGTIVGQTTKENPTKGNTFLIWRKGEPGNFELRCEYKIVGGNSGIQYRSFEVPNNKWVIGGYQADIDSGDTFSGINYGERFRGILCNRGQKTVIGDDGKPKVVGTIGETKDLQGKIKKEDWNEYRIVASVFHFEHYINGTLMSDCTDEDAKARRGTGVIALQLHAGPPMKVEFRNIRIKKVEIKEPGQQSAPTKSGASTSGAAKKKIVFISGKPSHGYGAHEHYAGNVLLAKALQNSNLGIQTDVIKNGWPSDPKALEGADAIVMYSDGGGGHMVNAHLKEVDELAKKGVGVVCLHYAVEIPKGESGDRFLDWIGGYFEANWSVNPHWTAKFTKFPVHPITRGVQPFSINDEWYYHMRFRPNMEGVTPILTDLPGEDTLKRGDGPHSGNADVRAAVLQRKEPQHVAWASENKGGGRGFGFTGGHDHWNWGDPNFRKLVLNAIAWTAKIEVPTNGVEDTQVTIPDLESNQDYPKPANFDENQIRNRLKMPLINKTTSAAAPANLATPATNPAPAPKPVAGREPADAVKGLDVAEGLQATLFAAEPKVLNLTNLDIDSRGRVWVCEVMNYRKHKGKRPEGDRILILEDKDGDGVADDVKVFYQGNDVDSAMGICVLGNKVIVSCSPNILVFTDEDGDDKPDSKQVLFTNTGAAQHDHSAHSFLFGPDGKFYWNFGNSGQKVCDKDGKEVVDLAGNKVVDNGKPYWGGMVFRCNPDGSEFETLAHNFRNNYEVAVDSFGTLWQSDNDDDGNKAVRINYVMEFGNYGYKDEKTGASWNTKRENVEKDIPSKHWHLNDPGVVPNLLITGQGSPTGICVYEGKLLPKIFQNQVIHCDAGPNVVRSYVATKDGAGYKPETVNVLHGARDNWFRPADVCVAPDGSLFVSDWYDPGVGGHNQQDSDRGRLFRLAPPGVKYTIPKFDFNTAEGAIEAFKNPALSVRYLAYTALHKLGKNGEKALESLISKTDDSRLKARAIWCLGKMSGEGKEAVELALKDSNPDIRIVGLRLARQLHADVIPVVRRLATDPATEVRRECAIALRDSKSADAPALWADLAAQHDGKDRWYLEALGIGAEKNWDAYLAAYLTKVGDATNTAAGRDIIWRSRAKKSPELLAKIIKAAKEEDQPRYFRAFDFLSGPEKDAALKSILE